MGCKSTKAVIQDHEYVSIPEKTPPPPREPSSSSSDDLGKTSDFESFQIQFENDSDEVCMI
jgi:hypothetical protein